MKTKLILFICTTLFIMSCRKGETFNFDPCEGKVASKADFQILENAGGFSIPDAWMETDTAFRGGQMRFQAIGDYDSLIWQIGFDNRTFKNQKTVTLSFNDAGNYTIKMVRYKKILGCFSNEKAIDTITKKMVLVNVTDSLGYALKKTPLRGLWKGYLVGKESDVFTISLKDWPSNELYMKNLPKGVNGYSTYSGSGSLVAPNSGFEIYSGYKNFTFDPNNLQSYGAKGSGKLIDYNTIKIEFSSIDTTISNWQNNLNPVKINNTFYGKRL